MFIRAAAARGYVCSLTPRHRTPRARSLFLLPGASPHLTPRRAYTPPIGPGNGADRRSFKPAYLLSWEAVNVVPVVCFSHVCAGPLRDS